MRGAVDRQSQTQAGTRIKGKVTRHCLVQFARLRAAGRRQHDLKFEVQVARRVRRNTAPFRAQLAPALRAGRHTHLHLPGRRGSRCCTRRLTTRVAPC